VSTPAPLPGWKQVTWVVALSAAAIEAHELGHRTVFWLTGTPARMGFQRVDPTVPVSEALRLWGKLGGPLVSLGLAIGFLLLLRDRRLFVLATAAFTNASLRVLPCSIDLLRAVRGGRPFSDEGDLALGLATGPAGRVALVGLWWLPFVVLTVLAARALPFQRHRWLKVGGVYVLSLAVGIGAVLLDELFGIHGN
jgi:hypothetical protein